MKLLLTFITLFLVIACSENKEYKTPESVINANIDFMNLEDLEGAMSTIHPDSPLFENTKNVMKQLFAMYDLIYKIEKLEVVKNDNNEAEVNFVQLTTKISGPEFRNNRISGKHILKKYKDSWKIFATQTTNVEYLN